MKNKKKTIELHFFPQFDTFSDAFLHFIHLRFVTISFGFRRKKRLLSLKIQKQKKIISNFFEIETEKFFAKINSEIIADV